MKHHFLITVLLAVVFCITGHFFMTAYIDYSINQSQVTLLRGQERFVNRQIKEYHEKLSQLDQVRSFVDNIDQLGLKSTQWDLFFVDLKEEPLSFLKLGAILNQTQNSAHYYFKPGSLSIRSAAAAFDITRSPGSAESGYMKNKAGQLDQNIRQVSSEAASSKIDVTINLDGRFIVRRKDAG